MIEIEDVTLHRGGAPILAGVSAAIPAQGMTALIGPNGAGKSSLLHVIAGLLAPSVGQVRLEGCAVHPSLPAWRAARMALLTQSQSLGARLSVRDLVVFGRWPHHRGHPRAADHAAVEAALELFDLRPLARRMIATLSGGQRQRAFLAMAFAQGTPWLLLDEPIAALDPRYCRDIMDRLHALSRPDAPDPRAVVVVLHDLGMTLRHADHVLALRSGRVAFAGPTAEVMTSAALSRLYETPLRVRALEDQAVVLAG